MFAIAACYNSIYDGSAYYGGSANYGSISYGYRSTNATGTYERLTKKFIQALFFLLFISSLAFSASGQAAPLRIAVSANFAPVLQQLLPEFTQQTGIKPQVISGVTGGLYQQIIHGAPYDIFLAADSLRPQQLAQKQLILANSRKTYAIGQLALYSATQANMSWQNFLQNLQQFSRIAIANPKTAPYGKAAKQCLVNQHQWQTVKNKLIVGNNINQTFQQLRSKAVDIGIVAYSQLVLNKLHGSLLPSHCYSVITQQLVILKNSKLLKQAQRFSQFMLSPQIQDKIAQYGYMSKQIKAKKNISNKVKNNG